MGRRHMYDCGSILIDVSVNSTISTALLADPHYQNAIGLMIQGPSSVTAATFNVEISLDAGTSFVVLQSGGSDITIPLDKAAAITYTGFDQIRVVASAAQGGDRTYIINAVEEI